MLLKLLAVAAVAAVVVDRVEESFGCLFLSLRIPFRIDAAAAAAAFVSPSAFGTNLFD